jgi:hypothetical protein
VAEARFFVGFLVFGSFLIFSLIFGFKAFKPRFSPPPISPLIVVFLDKNHSILLVVKLAKKSAKKNGCFFILELI